MTPTSSYPIPIYKLMVDGQDITPKISGGDGQRSRLIKLSLTDKRGGDADELTLELSDHDGALEIPPKGAKVSLWLGYQHSGLVDRGSYTVDEVSHAGPPDKLNIKCRAADLRKGLSTKREKSWHRTTLGAIARTIAQRHKLTPVINASLASIDIPHVDQADESDINLLSRLARQHDAIMTVKHGRLLLAPAGESTTASGAAMPQLTLTRAAGDAHDYKSADRDHYAGVRASYHDVQRAERGTVLAGSDRGQDDASEHADDAGEASDNVQVMRHTYPTKQAAQQAADAELRKIQRGNATMSYAMAVADPTMTAEVSVTLRGWGKPQIDRTWLVAELQFELDDGGLRCKLELEVGSAGRNENALRQGRAFSSAGGPPEGYAGGQRIRSFIRWQINRINLPAGAVRRDQQFFSDAGAAREPAGLSVDDYLADIAVAFGWPPIAYLSEWTLDDLIAWRERARVRVQPPDA